MNIKVTTNSLDETTELGKQLANNLRGGEVIELVGDLGAGKTALVRAVVPALGSQDDVASPSFTISRVYKTPKFEIYHFDFYRLPDAGVVGLELSELMDDPKTIVIIEWAETVRDILPADRLIIEIKSISETRRLFNMECPDKLRYLLGGIK